MPNVAFLSEVFSKSAQNFLGIQPDTLSQSQFRVPLSNEVCTGARELPTD